MLRITENLENDQTLRVRLDGTITGSTYSDLQAVFASHQESDGKIIILDMAGVIFMNHEAALKVAKLRSERLIRIINCSPFIVTLLETADKEQES